MKTIVLSDLTGTVLKQYQHERSAADAAANADYHARLQQRLEMRREAAISAKVAWDRRKWIKCLGHRLNLVAMRMSHAPKLPDLKTPSDAERKFEAGSAGEKRVLAEMEAALDDSWTALCGYRARANDGDVDVILVGPGGVFAIEIKNHNVRANCDGDTWWNDRNGDWVAIPPNDGRSPSIQLRQNTQVLRKYLAIADSFENMRTVVVFCHERSEIGAISNRKVDFVTTLRQWDISGWATGFPMKQPPHTSDAIVRSVMRSHSEWVRRRSHLASEYLITHKLAPAEHAS